MSIPSITYRDAIQIFSNAQDKDIYISHSLIPTKDKKESISLEEVNSLAQIAIAGLKKQRQEHPESGMKLHEQAITVRDYLFKVNDSYDSSKNKDTTPYEIFFKLCIEVQDEIKQITALEVDSKNFSDDELLKIPNVHYDDDLQRHGIKSQQTKIRLAKLVAQKNGWHIFEHILDYGINDQKGFD